MIVNIHATRIIVSEVEQKKLGIVVDEVLEVLRVPHRCIEEAPDVVQEGLQKAIAGLANLNDRMLVILDLENLLQEKEWEAVKTINEQELKGKKATVKTRMKKQGVK